METASRCCVVIVITVLAFLLILPTNKAYVLAYSQGDQNIIILTSGVNLSLPQSQIGQQSISPQSVQALNRGGDDRLQPANSDSGLFSRSQPFSLFVATASIQPMDPASTGALTSSLSYQPGNVIHNAASQKGETSKLPISKVGEKTALDSRGDIMMPAPASGKIAIEDGNLNMQVGVKNQSLVAGQLQDNIGVDLLENHPASVEAQIQDINKQLNTQTAQIVQLEQEENEQSQGIADLKQAINNLVNQQSALGFGSGESPDGNSQIPQLPLGYQDQPLMPAETLFASESAQLKPSVINVGGPVTQVKGVNIDAPIKDGKDTMTTAGYSQLAVTGEIVQKQNISVGEGFNTQGSSDLLLPAAMNVQRINLFDGKITLDNKGELKAVTVTSNQFRLNNNQSEGSVTLPKGHTFVDVNNPYIESNSIVVVNPNIPLEQTPAVVNKQNGKSFTIQLAKPVTTTDIIFTYFIVGIGK